MLPTRGKLIHVEMTFYSDCPFCYHVEENIDHIYKNYIFTINI